MISRMHILLIDENAADVRLTREYLSEVKDFSFELTHANRLKTGLEYLATGDAPFDVILLDLSLPDSQDLDALINLPRPNLFAHYCTVWN